MALTVKQGAGGEFELVPEGQYTARCFKVIDLGTQEVEWQGESKLQPKVMITWEILDDPKMKDGRPFAVTKQYTASLNENSHLYKDLVAWRGKAFTKDELLGFDISKLLGAYCTIQVVHTESGGRTYANINAIMGTKDRPKGINPEVMFDIAEPNMEIFESLSDYLKDKIRASQEWQAKEMMENQDGPVSKEIQLGDIDQTFPEAEEVKDEEIDISDIPF